MLCIFLNVLCEEAVTGGVLLKKFFEKFCKFNQEFVRAKHFSSNQGTLINIHLQHKKDGPCREKCRVFLLKKLKRSILNEKFNQQMATIWALFLKISELFSSFRESAGEISTALPSSYTPVVIRACRILLLTKFTIMKLKTDVFSISTIFLEGVLHWKLSVASFVERSLYSPAQLKGSVKQLCRLKLGL